jgi:deoxyribodipyrimidine photo-lyase
VIWREFYLNLLGHFPETLGVEFDRNFRAREWPGKTAHFERWCAGETGFPIVDAATRQLQQTGFMPNQARMIVAMFLTKDLLIDWPWGESYLMQPLTDGEIASNNEGWQRSAGTGADAAPYFRIFNPWTQTARLDSHGEYIKTWIPELRDVPAERLVRPPNGSLAKNYPVPIVDHREAHRKALELLKRYQSRTV